MARLATWDPWRDLEELQNEVNRLFRRRPAAMRRAEYPPANVWQAEHSLMLTMELPGYETDQLDITVVGDTVTVRGAKRDGEVPEGATYRRQERPRDAFNRTVELPFEVDPQRTEASYEKGVLTLKLHRPEEHKPRKIQIKAG